MGESEDTWEGAGRAFVWGVPGKGCGLVVVDQNAKEDDQELAGVWKLRHTGESFGNNEEYVWKGLDRADLTFIYACLPTARAQLHMSHGWGAGQLGKAVWSCLRCFWECSMKLKANALSMWL